MNINQSTCTDLWDNDIIEVAIETSLLGEDVVRGSGVEDAQRPGQRRMRAEADR